MPIIFFAHAAYSISPKPPLQYPRRAVTCTAGFCSAFPTCVIPEWFLRQLGLVLYTGDIITYAEWRDSGSGIFSRMRVSLKFGTMEKSKQTSFVVVRLRERERERESRREEVSCFGTNAERWGSDSPPLDRSIEAVLNWLVTNQHSDKALKGMLISTPFISFKLHSRSLLNCSSKRGSESGSERPPLVYNTRRRFMPTIMFSKALILLAVAVAVSMPSSTYAYTPPYASSYTTPPAPPPPSYTPGAPSPSPPAPSYSPGAPSPPAPSYTPGAPSPPASTPGAPSRCVYACIVPAAAQNGCSGIEDLPCVCRNAQFQSDAGACLVQHCPPSDLQPALQLQQQACAAGGLTPSFSATPSPRPVSFASIPVSPTAPGSSSSSGRPSVSPSPPAAPTTPAVSSVSRSATAVAVGSSTSPSTAAGTTSQVGAGAFFGAILAAVFAF